MRQQRSHTTGTASSAPAPPAWPWRRISSSAASPSIAWSVSPTSAGFGILPPKAASSTRRRTWSPPSAPPASTTCRCWTRTIPSIRATSACWATSATSSRTFGLAPHIELGKAVTKVAPRGDKLWEVAVAGEAEPAPLSRRGGGERPSRCAAHADLSRHVHRRDRCIRAATRAPSRCATGACWWWAAATPRPTSCPMPCTAARRCSSASAAATGSCPSSSWASRPATCSPPSR